MRLIYSKYILIITLIFLIIACDSGNNRKLETLEKEQKVDSSKVQKNKYKKKLHETKDFLIGKWLRPKDISNSSDGFDFKKDFTFELINSKELIADSWEVKEDTLYLWMHTNIYPDKELYLFSIIDLNDSVMVIASLDTNKKNREIYRKTN